MPLMATSSKRKWSDVFNEKEACDKQCIMDLCTSKLRYVNPAQPPRRRTEVPLLRNVLIVNMMKHLSVEMKIERPVEYSSEDLIVDPSHFEGLPPLSELLTDIMLDPLPSEQQQVANSLVWTDTGESSYSDMTPVELNISSCVRSSDSSVKVHEDAVVHGLLPCIEAEEIDHIQHSRSWDSPNGSTEQSSLWPASNGLGQHSPSWIVSNESSVLDSLLPSSACHQQSSGDSLETLTSDSTFQPSSDPLPSFSSLFESTQCPSFTEMLQTNLLQESSSTCSAVSSAFSSSSSFSSFSSLSNPSADDFIGSFNLTDSELEFLAMTFSSKLPPSFEDLIHSLPQTSLLQQTCQPSQTFYVPSSLQDMDSSDCDSVTTAINQCASYCRQDQPSTSVDDNSMIRVLVNL